MLQCTVTFIKRAESHDWDMLTVNQLHMDKKWQKTLLHAVACIFTFVRCACFLFPDVTVFFSGCCSWLSMLECADSKAAPTLSEANSSKHLRYCFKIALDCSGNICRRIVRIVFDRIHNIMIYSDKNVTYDGEPMKIPSSITKALSVHRSFGRIILTFGPSKCIADVSNQNYWLYLLP